MPAYNFKQQFAAAVESGHKRQTIRQTTKGASTGATAYLYTGQRTSSCRKLGEGIIASVLPIEIGRNTYDAPYVIFTETTGATSLLIFRDLDRLAIADGFTTGEEMVDWFASQYGLPFTGYLHQWKPQPLHA